MEKRNLNLFDAGIAFVMAFVLAQITSILGVSVTQSIMKACGQTASQISVFWDGAVGYLLQAVYMNIAFVLVFVWYYKKRNSNNVLQLTKPTSNTSKYVIWCVMLGIATLFLLSGILNYFQLFLDKLGFTSNTLSYELNSPTKYFISLISMAVIPAICEEIIFRGIITKALTKKGEIFAIVVSSIMFALFHFSLSQLIYPLCFGLILGVVYLRTKNIIFPILLHFINNALSISIQYFSSGETSAFTHSTSMLIYAIVTFAIWIYAMYRLFNDFKANQSNEINESDQKANQSIKTTTNNNQLINNKQDEHILYGSIAIMVVLYLILIFI